MYHNRKRKLFAILSVVGLSLGTAAGFAAIMGTGRAPSASVAASSPIIASYPSESFGGALADEAAKDSSTVMYCTQDASSNGTATSALDCGLHPARHAGVGPFTTANYLSSVAGDAARAPTAFAGDFHFCALVKPTSFAAASTIYFDGRLATAATDTGTFAWLTQTDGKAAAYFLDGVGGSTTLTSAAGATLNAINLVCWGRSGTTGYVKLNNGATVSGAVTIGPSLALAAAYVGVINNNGSIASPFTGTLYELAASTTAASDALFTSAWTTASTCRAAGRCLPTSAGEVMYLNGDDYLAGGAWISRTAGAALVGVTGGNTTSGYWGGGRVLAYSDAWEDVLGFPPRDRAVRLTFGGQTFDTGFTVASSATTLLATYQPVPPGFNGIVNVVPLDTAALALTGSLLTARSRYGWPSLTWTQNGTVPRATQSNLYPEGFGAKHGGIGGFAAGVNLQQGSGNDVFDTTVHTMCMIVGTPATFASAANLYGNGAFQDTGVYLYQGAGAASMTFNYNGAGVNYATFGAIVAATDNVLCWGRDASDNIISKTNDNAVSAPVASPNHTLGTGKIAYLGTHSTISIPATGWTIKEVFYTLTPVSSGYITSLTSSALSCTRPGTCFTPDANTVMHCYVPSAGKWECPINTGGTAWTQNGTLTKTTPARYVWPAGVDKRDAEGAGPFANANYLRASAAPGPLNFSGDFSCHLVFNLTATAGTEGGQHTLISDGTAAASGYDVIARELGTPTVAYYEFETLEKVETANVASFTGSNVVSFGRSGASHIIKLNGGTAATNALAQRATGTIAAYLGRELRDGYSHKGTTSELLCSSTPASDALFTRIQRTFFDHQGSTRQPVTVTRTTEATAVIDGRLYRYPAGTLRATPSGKLYEGSVVNAAQYSSQLEQSPSDAGWVAWGPPDAAAPGLDAGP